MNKPVFYIIFCLLAMPLFAQTNPESENLVPNGSFEELYWCPYQIGEFTALKDWYIIYDSPDVFNSCVSAPTYGTPQNWLGFQYPRTGNGYIGAGLYLSNEYNSWPAREMFQVKLNKKLVKGQEYCASMYVSLSDSSQYAISNIGMYFGDTKFLPSGTMDTTLMFSLYPQVYNNSNNLLKDKDKWMKIEGSFIADGTEQYLSIGNFNRSVEIDTFSFNKYSNLGLGMAYYYFDDVEVRMCNYIEPKIKIPNVFTPNFDGVNDMFFIEIEGVSSYTMEILNRWGNLVGYLSQEVPYWDGQNKGKRITSGVYFYKLIYTDFQFKKYQKTGFIHIFY
ncbi:MAG: gliding motility-associated C-terminal domain-containing protein [Brumimicrobium sp.]